MEDTQTKPDPERDQLVRVLGTLYKTAEHASLTGAFRKGSTDAAGYYNRVLARFVERGDVSHALFPSLDEHASFDQVGVAAKLLAGYLFDDSPRRSKEVRLDFDGLSHLGEVGKRIRDEFKGRGGRGGIKISFGDEIDDAEEAREKEADEV